MSNQTEILLESGTNELEIMEFTISGNTYGINVAKVTEIMTAAEFVPMQKSHPDIEGVFKPRDKVIPIINLVSYLNLEPSANPERDIFILTSFNELDFAFHVHTIVGIDRISWTQINKPDQVIYGGDEGVATGIADYENRLITILDFEKIVSEISPSTGIQTSDVDQLGERQRSENPILIAEDSAFLLKIILESLHKAGYTNVIKTENGQEAWDYLEAARDKGGNILDEVSCIISDIEMPQMDGHRLTKLVKTDKTLCEIPIVLFSSLISEEVYRKGVELGADEQITKPQIVRLVTILDNLIKPN